MSTDKQRKALQAGAEYMVFLGHLTFYRRIMGSSAYSAEYRVAAHKNLVAGLQENIRIRRRFNFKEPLGEACVQLAHKLWLEGVDFTAAGLTEYEQAVTEYHDYLHSL